MLNLLLRRWCWCCCWDVIASAILALAEAFPCGRTNSYHVGRAWNNTQLFPTVGPPQLMQEQFFSPLCYFHFTHLTFFTIFPDFFFCENTRLTKRQPPWNTQLTSNSWPQIEWNFFRSSRVAIFHVSRKIYPSFLARARIFHPPPSPSWARKLFM